MDENEKLYNDSEMTELDSQPKVQKIQGVDTINKVSTVSSTTPLSLGVNDTPKVKTTSPTSTVKQQEDEAKNQAQLDLATGVEHVLDDINLEEYISTKDLYEKNLGITEYDELRAKLHLKDDESFTDYYNRTHYVPEGFEMQAKLLLAEEKRKKLYVEVEAGNMSEEDFLYEAYGKDLLKQEGIDFDSKLYWYQRYKNKQYDDPRDNDLFMAQLIDQARELFQGEKWAQEKTTKKLNDTLAGYVTGETLSTEDVATIFADQFEQLDEYFESREQIIKYYRAGLLSGFNPTIDTDGDGKIDYYYSPDGKLYNVNETGKGANTYRAYYNDDGSLNRIVAQDSYAGELGMSALKGFCGFFTGIVDFFGMVGGLVVDLGEGVFTGDWDLSATTEVSATLGQFWNGTFLGNTDYTTSSTFKNSDGSTNWAGIGKGAAGLAGTIAAFVATWGISAAAGAMKGASTAVTKAGATGVKAMAKKTVCKVGSAVLNTGVRLTSWANGTAGAGGTIRSIVGNAATTALKDSLNGAVQLTVNREVLAANGTTDHVLSDGEIFGQMFGSFAINFAAGVALRSAVGTTALDRWSTVGKEIHNKHWGALKTIWTAAPKTLKVVEQSLAKRITIGVGNMAMDAVDNIIGTWTQTSLATKGKVLDWNSLGDIMQSPSLWMNIAYQTKMNFKDNFSFTGAEVASSVANIAELELGLKNKIQSAAAEKIDDPEMYQALKAVADNYETRIKELVAEKGELMGRAQAFEEVADKLGLIEEAKDYKPSVAISEARKKMTAEEKAKLNPITELIQKGFDKVSSLEIDYTNAMIEFMNGVYAKQVLASKNIIKNWGFKQLYGKEVKNYVTLAANTFRSYAMNDERAVEWDVAIKNMFEKTDLYQELADTLKDTGAGILDNLDDPQIVGGRVIRNKDGKLEIEGGLFNELKDKPEALNKALEDAQAMADDGRAEAFNSGIYILTRNTGTEQDGNQERITSIRGLDVVKSLLDFTEGDGTDNPILKKYGDAYVINFYGLGEQFTTIEQIRGMLQAVSAIRLSTLSSDLLDNKSAATYMRTLLGYLTTTKTDADTVLDTDNGATAATQVINSLINSGLINHGDAARLIRSLNKYMEANNTKVKSLPTYKLNSIEGVLKTNEGISYDISKYNTAVEVLEASDKIAKAEEIALSLRQYQSSPDKQKSKYKKLAQSEQTALEEVRNLLNDNPTVAKILNTDLGIDTEGLKKVLNPFTNGLVDKESLNIALEAEQKNGSQILSSQNSSTKIDLINSYSILLGAVDDANILDSTIDIEINKNNKLSTTLKELTTWKAFSKFAKSEDPTSPGKLLQKRGIKLDPAESINSPAYFDKLLETYKQGNHATNDVKEVTRLVNTLKNKYIEYVTEAVPKIINQHKLTVDPDVFYRQFETDLTKVGYDSQGNITGFKDFVSKSYTDGSRAVTINEAIAFVKQHKIPTGLGDRFAELYKHYGALTKNATALKNSDIIIIRLSECLGPLMQKAVYKLQDPEVEARISGKESNDIAKELFTNIKDQYAFEQEFNNINKLIEDYGDELVIPVTRLAEARAHLKKIGYDFAGNLDYTSNTKLPGVYYVKDQMGFSVGDSKLLASLESLAQSITTNKKTSTKVVFQDPISKADVLMGGLNFTPMDSVVKEVTLCPVLKEENITNMKLVKKFEAELSNNKIGKAASTTESSPREYTSFALSEEYNDKHKMAIYMYNIVNQLDKYYKDTEGKASAAVIKIVSKEEPKIDYNKLWNASTEQDADGNYVTTISKKSSDFNFAEEAMTLIDDKGINYETINQIIPNNINNIRQTNITTQDIGNQTTNIARSPAGYIAHYLLQDFNLDPEVFTKELLQMQDGINYDISIRGYDDAINKTKTELLEADPTNNIFIEIQQASIKYEQAMREGIIKHISQWVDAGTSQNNLIKLLTSSDHRRDIGQALRLILNVDTESNEINNSKHLLANGDLKITDELIAELQSKINLDTDEVKDTEALKHYLAMLSVSTFKKTSSFQAPDSIEQKLYAAIRSATTQDSDTAYISLQDLYNLSDEDLDKVNEILIKVGGKKLSKDVLDIIKESPLRDKHTELEATTYRQEQGETVQNTFDTTKGFILTEEDFNKQDKHLLNNKAIEALRTRAATIRNAKRFTKLSSLDEDKNLGISSLITKKLLDVSKSKTGILNHVSYPGSLVRTNFSNNEVIFKHLNTMADFALELQEYDSFKGLTPEQSMALALEVYDKTTGTEMQNIHPDYMLVNNKTGEVIDVVSSNFHDNMANLLSSIINNDNGTDDISIIRLHRNSLNNIYADTSTKPIEVYKLSDNREAVAYMIKSRMDKIASINNIKQGDRDLLIKKTSEYFAEKVMSTPKYYNDMLYSMADKFGIREEAIRSYITSTEGLRSDLSYRKLHQESMNTILRGSSEEESTAFKVQQLRDISSYGETQETFRNIEGMEESIEATNKEIYSELELIDKHNYKQVEELLTIFEEASEPYKFQDYATALIKKQNLPKDKIPQFVNELTKYYIMKQDSIAANLFKLSGSSFERAITESKRSFASLPIFKIENGKVVQGDNIAVKQALTKPKLIIDIEQLFHRATNKEHIYQIAYKYGDSEGVVYLREGLDLSKLEETYKDFFLQYGNESGTKKSIARLKMEDVDTKEVSLDDFKAIISKAVSEQALLVGYNSNNFDIPKLLANQKLGLTDLSKLQCMDIYELAKRLPTTENIDMFNGELKLSRLGRQLGFDVTDEHDGLADARLTNLIGEHLLNNAIKQDNHHNKFINDVQNFYNGLTFKELSESSIYKESLPNKLIGNLKTDLDRINSYKNNTQKFYDFTQMLNVINEKAMSDYVNIRRKEIDLAVRTHNFDSIIEFGALMEKNYNHNKVMNMMGYWYDSLVKQYAESGNTSDPLIEMAETLRKLSGSKILKTKELIELFSNPDLLKESLQKVINADENFTDRTGSGLYDHLKKNYNKVDANSMATNDAAYFLTQTIKPLDDLVDTYLLSNVDPSLKEAIKNRYDQAFTRFYNEEVDDQGNLVHKDRPTRAKSLNLLSNTQQEVINYLKQSPTLRTEYESIYELAQTTYNPIKLLDGTTERPRNDTIYLTRDTLNRLMDSDKTNIQGLYEYYGYNGEVYLPIIRHPRDIADSLHFLKIKLIDDSEGFNLVMNIDTMKSKFNGDFDGDHITILKPQQFLSEYATAINTYKNGAYNILDQLMDKLVKSDNFESYKNIETKVYSNQSLNEQLRKDCAELNKMSGNIEAEYNTRKERFLSEENIKIFTALGYTEDEARQALEDIYLVKPIEIKSTIAQTNEDKGKTFVTYTDFLGMYKNSDNIKAKALYTQNSLSSAIALAKLDSLSGMFQKGKMQQDLTSEFSKGFQTIDRSITLSRTTKRLLDNNIESAKSLLEPLITNPNIKHLINEAKSGQDIETALRVYQLDLQSKMWKDPTVVDTFKSLKTHYANDDFVKSINRFSKGNNPEDFDKAMAEFVYSIDDLENLTKQTKSEFGYRSSKDGLNNLINYMSGVSQKGILKSNDPILQDMSKPLDTIFLWNHDMKDNIIGEDGHLLLPGINKYSFALPKAMKLADADAEYIRAKYFTDDSINVINNLKDSKVLKMFGLKPNSNYTISLDRDESGVFTIYKVFKADKTKLGVAGSPDMKGVPQGWANINSFPEGLRTLVSESSVLKDKTWIKPEKVNSLFKSHDYICYNKEGEEIKHEPGVIPKETYLIKTSMDISSLEATPTWNKDVKSAASDALNIGNSLLDTGGISQLKAAFYDIDDAGNLIFDDQGHAEMMRRYAKLNNPHAIENSAIEAYELAQLAILRKYITDKDVKYHNVNSVDELILKKLDSQAKTLGSFIQQLKMRADINDYNPNSLEYKLLFDNDLYSKVYGYTTDIANEGNKKAAKGSNRRNTIQQSKVATDTKTGGAGKATNLFAETPSFSYKDLVNTINPKYKLYDNNLQLLMEQGRLPIGSYTKANPDYNINYDDAKIGESYGNVTREYGGARIQTTDMFDYQQIKKYSDLNRARGFDSSLDIRKTNSKFTDTQTGYLALMLKALTPDANGRFNKYSIIEGLSTGINRFNISYDPSTFKFTDSNLDYSADQYIPVHRKELTGPEQLTAVTPDEAIDYLLKMRSSPNYFTHKEEVASKYVEGISNIPEAPIVSNDIDQEGLADLQIRKPKTISEEYAPLLEEYKYSVNSSDELSKVLAETNITYGGKVVDQHKTFKLEKIMMNHGVKIEDADSLIQDRNMKQTIIDQINYSNDYSKDLITLYNYGNKKGSIEVINTYAYLIAADSKLKSIDKQLTTKNSKIKESLERNKLSILESIKDLGIKDQQELQTKLASIAKTNQVEVHYVNKIIKGIYNDSSKFSKLLDQPTDNIFYIITQNSHKDKNVRKGIVENIKNMFKNQPVQSNAPEDKESLPLFDSYNFLDSMNATIQLTAKSKAIYENSIRLRKNGVIDNSKVQKVLIDTIEQYRTSLEQDIPNSENYKEPLRNTISVIAEQLSPYLRHTKDDESGTYNQLVNIDAKLAPNSNYPVGKACLELFELLSKVSSETNLNYDTVRLDTTNVSDAKKFIYCQEQIQSLFSTLSAMTNDKLVKGLVDNISRYAKSNNLSFVDKNGKLIDISKVYQLHELDLKSLTDRVDMGINNQQRYATWLADQITKGEVYLMDSSLAEAYAKSIFKEYKKPGKLMSLIRKSSNLCIKLLMSSPFKLIDRFLKFTAFDATTLGTANIETFAYEGQAFKDLKAYFQSKGSYSSEDLSEFLETQGIKMNGDNFNILLNMDSNDSSSLFKSYTDKVGNVFTFQTLSQRYAYWLATKNSLKDGDYSVLGSAYHLREAIKGLEEVKDSDGKVRVTKEGQQAAFAMAQMLGSPNDFPGASKQLNDAGFVFTTFPLAALRWGTGELRSMSAAIKGMFTEGVKSDNTKWLLRQSSGIIGTFIVESLLIQLIADMFGVGDDEEQIEEWKKKGALPNVTQTLIQNQPIMDTFSSMNIAREFYGLTLEPWLDKGDENDTSVSGLKRFAYKNIVSHINPIAKNIYEVATKKDIIDDQVIDTADKYSGFENLFRKLSSYVLGASGANALTKTLQEDQGFSKGLSNAIKAEMGNTKAVKENQKNYYNALSIVNSYIDYSTDTYNNNSNFNYSRYSEAKSRIYKLLNARASATEVYQEINNLAKEGYTMYEIRSALRNCSLGYKLTKLENQYEFMNSLTDAEIQNIKTALAYEEHMFPWLESEAAELTATIEESENSNYNSYLNLSAYRPNYYAGSYTAPDYSYSYSDNKYNSNNYNYNPYDTYTRYQENLKYQQQQAEYKRNKKQWEDN